MRCRATDDELALGMVRLAPAYLHEAPVERLTSLMAGTVFSATAMRRGFEELASWSAVDRLSSVDVPTLVIAGRHDAFTSWPQADRTAARLPHADVAVLSEAVTFHGSKNPTPSSTRSRVGYEPTTSHDLNNASRHLR